MSEAYIECPLCRQILGEFDVFDHPCDPDWFFDLRKTPPRVSGKASGSQSLPTGTAANRHLSRQSSPNQATWKF